MQLKSLFNDLKSFVDGLHSESVSGGSGDSEDTSDEYPSDGTEHDSAPAEDRSDEWWYYRYKHNWRTGDEALRMAPMQSADEAETIEVEIYHQGNRNAAEVMAVYAEFGLRDAWGDRYHIDVSIHEKAVNVATSDEFFGWVDDQDDVAKDCNLLVASGGGWNLIGGGDAAITHRAEVIERLYGQPLYVDGRTDGHHHAATGMHELGHCLGFSHGDGGRIGSAITPMGHYTSSGSTYSFRYHPDVRKTTPEVQ